jgi:hypothetical protein
MEIGFPLVPARPYQSGTNVGNKRRLLPTSGSRYQQVGIHGSNGDESVERSGAALGEAEI